MRAQQVTPADAEHGEGPVWSKAWGGLRWVDMLVGDVLMLDESGTVERTHVGSVAAVVRPRTAGGAVLALENELVVTEGSLADLAPFVQIAVPTGLRLNEGACAPDGSFYCGTAPVEAAHRPASLYRVEPGGRVHLELDEVGVSNGLDFSPDERTAYFVDTALHRIDAFDYTAEEGLSERRVWVDVPVEDGLADGLTVDAEGGVWLALFGGGKVHRYDSHGRLDHVVELPTTQVTACTFGGSDLGHLFVTTSKRRAAADELHLAGAVYLADCGVQGKPTLTFDG